MKLLKVYTYEIKKSKFIAYYYEIKSTSEAKEILENLKKEHKRARHIPYAYKCSNTASKSDDKEPKNTAGTPIFNMLENKNLDNVLIAVVRYFGGTKLGAGGLTRAYLEATKRVINENEKS